MENLHIKQVNFDDFDKEYIFIRDMPINENGVSNPYHGIEEGEFKNAIAQMVDYANGKNLPLGFVPMTTLFLWWGEDIVGLFRVRHFLNDQLKGGAGHIGYFIKKEFRGRGFAKEGLRLTLEFAKSLVKEEEFFLRVDKLNLASLKVIQSNGGKIYREDEEKYYLKIKKESSK